MTQSPVTMFNVWLRKSGGLPAQSADVALDASVVRRFQADDVLFSAGDRPDVLYFTQSGLVRFFYLTDDGKEFNKNFVAAGSVVTSLSTFLSGVPSPFFTQALEDTVTIALPMEFVRRQVEADIYWERLLSRSVAMLALKKEQREASFLLQDAGARYEAFLDDFPDLAPRLPQYHIASYLGITPVALSRIRARRGKQRTS
ncbi:MAG: Crp/Fnr family transcriptional regulator [Labrenzia sp.]